MLTWQEIDKAANRPAPESDSVSGGVARAAIVWRTNDSSYVRRLNCALQRVYECGGEDGLVSFFREIVASWNEAPENRDAALQVFGHTNGIPGRPLWGIVTASGTKLFVLHGAVGKIYIDHADVPANSILLEAAGRPEFVSCVIDAILHGHSLLHVGKGVYVCLPVVFEKVQK